MPEVNLPTPLVHTCMIEGITFCIRPTLSLLHTVEQLASEDNEHAISMFVDTVSRVMSRHHTHEEIQIFLDNMDTAQIMAFISGQYEEADADAPLASPGEDPLHSLLSTRD